jgi:SnoaL-like protein
MKKKSVFLFLFGLLIFLQSCQKQQNDLTESEKKEITAAAKVTVQKVFECSNNLQFMNGLSFYSEDANAYYTSNGTVLSLNELKESYRQIVPAVETLKNSIDSWNATVISKDAVAFTLPIHLKIKLKEIPEYNGQLVWTGVVQKENGKWLIVQSHESWLNCAEVAAALTPKNNNEK